MRHDPTPHSQLPTMVLLLALVLSLAAVSTRLAASDPGTNNWPMWGGTPDRNQVSSMKNVPSEWDVKSKKNIKWVAELGSQSYGNPIVAGGKRHALGHGVAEGLPVGQAGVDRHLYEGHLFYRVHRAECRAQSARVSYALCLMPGVGGQGLGVRG